MAYVFSRLTGSVKPDYKAIADSGATVALNAEDPDLANQIAEARQNGAKVAIWLPAHQDQDPVQYAQHMASLEQYYKPDDILPNLEGPQNKASSGGAEWNAKMMAEYSKYVPSGTGAKLNVVTEPGETDFDYHPFINYGGGVVNEAFTGDMTQKDPNALRQKLIDAGVPPDRINMLLAPGQKPPTDGTFSAYTWDDMTPAQHQSWLAAYKGRGGGNFSQVHSPGGISGGFVKYNPAGSQYHAVPPEKPGGADQFHAVPPAHPTTGPGTGGQDQYSQVPDTAPAWSQVTDAHNPQAQAYARSRLAQFGIKVPPGQDAAAAWREFSAKFYGARAEAAAAGPVDQGEDVVDLTRGGQPPHAVGVTPARSMGNILAAARARAANAIVRNPQLSTSGAQPVPNPAAPSNTAVAPGVPAPVVQPPHIVAPPSAVTTPIRYAPSAPTRITQEDILAAARSRAGMI